MDTLLVQCVSPANMSAGSVTVVDRTARETTSSFALELDRALETSPGRSRRYLSADQGEEGEEEKNQSESRSMLSAMNPVVSPLLPDLPQAGQNGAAGVEPARSLAGRESPPPIPKPAFADSDALIPPPATAVAAMPETTGLEIERTLADTGEHASARVSVETSPQPRTTSVRPALTNEGTLSKVAADGSESEVAEESVGMPMPSMRGFSMNPGPQADLSHAHQPTAQRQDSGGPSTSPATASQVSSPALGPAPSAQNPTREQCRIAELVSGFEAATVELVAPASGGHIEASNPQLAPSNPHQLASPAKPQQAHKDSTATVLIETPGPSSRRLADSAPNQNASQVVSDTKAEDTTPLSLQAQPLHSTPAPAQTAKGHTNSREHTGDAAPNLAANDTAQTANRFAQGPTKGPSEIANLLMALEGSAVGPVLPPTGGLISDGAKVPPQRNATSGSGSEAKDPQPTPSSPEQLVSPSKPQTGPDTPAGAVTPGGQVFGDPSPAVHAQRVSETKYPGGEKIHGRSNLSLAESASGRDPRQEANSTAGEHGILPGSQAQPLHVPPAPTQTPAAHASSRDRKANQEGSPADGLPLPDPNTAVLFKQASSNIEGGAARIASEALLTSQPTERPASSPLEAASGHASTHQPADETATPATWDNYRGHVGRTVNSAWLRGQADRTEMHIELRSGPLGPLAVHAVVREGEVGAAIRVENRQAQTILATELPALERALGERNLRVENIAVYQGTVAGGMSDRGGADSYSRPFTQQVSDVRWAGDPGQDPAPNLTADIAELEYPQSRLSIRA